MTALQELAAHIPDELVVVDVGCRWGFAPHWEALGSHVALIGFDADETEVVRLRESFADRTGMRFYARTLGAKRGRATLIRTHEAAGTSVLRTDRARLTHIPDHGEGRVTGEETVEVSTLDEWMDEDGLTRVDALKLDTQGSELDILRGSTQALRHARHLEVEVALNELFEGGPLFGEVDAFRASPRFRTVASSRPGSLRSARSSRPTRGYRAVLVPRRAGADRRTRRPAHLVQCALRAKGDVRGSY